MARVRTYETDDTITGGDKILGTNIVGNGTENFTVADLKEYIETGIDIPKFVPPYFVPVINSEGTNAQPGSLRELRTTQTQDITFTPNGTESDIWDQPGRVGALYISYVGGLFLVIEDWKSRFDILSLVGKTVSGTFGEEDAEVEFTIDSLERVEDTSGEERDYEIIDGKILFKFNITWVDEFDFNNAREDYSLFEVKAEDNDNETLDLVTWHFYGHAEMTNVSIDELHADRIIFDETSDPMVTEEGIIWGDTSENGPHHTMFLNEDGDVDLARVNSNSLKFVIDTDVNITEDLDVDGNLNVDGNTTLDGTLEVDGVSDFDADVDINNSSLEVYGTSESGNRLRLRTTEGSEDDTEVSISKDGIFVHDYDGVAREIEFVHANTTVSWKDASDENVTIDNFGTLTQIQIGERYYTIPSGLSQVASQLPGLSEALSPKDADADDTDTSTTGTFFYGTDEGTHVNFESALSTAVPGFTFEDNKTFTTAASGSRAALNTAFSNIPAEQALFFVESANTFDFSAASQGDTVSGAVYEVINYIHSGDNLGYFQFSKIGEGNIVFSAPTLTFNNIPATEDDDNNLYDFLTRDRDDHSIQYRELEEVGVPFQNIVTYTNTENDDAALRVSGILFEGTNVETSGGNITVGTNGRIPFQNAGAEITDDHTANAWEGVILGYITDAKTLTLPAIVDGGEELKSGTIVRVINLSDLYSEGDNAGQQRTGDDVGETWSVTGNGTDKIMYDAGTIELNDASSNDFIYSGNQDIGWIIK